jgi:hypothetical protein
VREQREPDFGDTSFCELDSTFQPDFAAAKISGVPVSNLDWESVDALRGNGGLEVLSEVALRSLMPNISVKALVKRSTGDPEV